MDISELKEIEYRVISLSLNVGAWMKQQSADEATAEIKSTNNLVTHVDRESEKMFVDGLASIFPEAGFIAEEGTGQALAGFNWVIDPLDGTTNFVHRIPVWCTSVALCKNHEPVCGVIYDPNSGECFSAHRGGGARLNGKPIQTSPIEKLEQSLLATGFPYHDFGRAAEYISVFRSLMHESRGMRRLGSAALDMAWVACGRFEAFYEYGLNPWDVAAGTIIGREAGGMVTGFDREADPVFGRDIICSNGLVHNQLSEVIARYFI